ncbi:MAG: hypothetical protein ACREO1_02755 [Arenimonas sp.]
MNETLKRIFLILAGMLLLAACNMKDSFESTGNHAMKIGGIESITVDGIEYFFGYSYTDDRVLTSLYTNKDAMADYATKALKQRDGAHDKAFWLEQIKQSRIESGLSDLEGREINLKELKAALSQLKQSAQDDQTIPALEIPSHLGYLLEMNCDWPNADPPVSIQQAAVRLGLEADDISPWLDESGSVLNGRNPLPKDASFQDAKAVFEWYWQTLIDNQSFDWNRQLGFN